MGEIIITIIIAGFFGWMFGFLSFLHRYQREERCYLCDEKVLTKQWLTCDECDEYSRSMSDSNLARELSQVTKRLTEVNTYRLKGFLGTYRDKNERYEEVKETIVCTDNFIDLLKNITDYTADGSIEIILEPDSIGKPKPKYVVT